MILLRCRERRIRRRNNNKKKSECCDWDKEEKRDATDTINEEGNVTYTTPAQSHQLNVTFTIFLLFFFNCYFCLIFSISHQSQRSLFMLLWTSLPAK